MQGKLYGKIFVIEPCSYNFNSHSRFKKIKGLALIVGPLLFLREEIQWYGFCRVGYKVVAYCNPCI